MNWSMYMSQVYLLLIFESHIFNIIGQMYVIHFGLKRVNFSLIFTDQKTFINLYGNICSVSESGQKE